MNEAQKKAVEDAATHHSMNENNTHYGFIAGASFGFELRDDEVNGLEAEVCRLTNFGDRELLSQLKDSKSESKKLVEALEEIRDTKWSSETVNPLKHIARAALKHFRGEE